ncbi:HAD family hydrolase [Streptomyces sp. NPDC087420]|uniref:HAD family hydrolase n=1 Tax=Streptomyces sp. NPDC087420 TaxID=3365785 RepID=UPI00383322B4
MTGEESPDLGIPAHIQACLFDLDGVLTPTAALHATAWKTTFDGFLERRDGPGYRPFDKVTDYDEYVDGLPRADGVRSFLASRGIELPEGSADDPPDRDTVRSLGERKNDLLLQDIRTKGVEAYPGSVRFVRAVKDAGLHRAVVSSSANCRDVLIGAGIEDLFEVRIDAGVAHEQHLAGKPKPDTFLAAARALGVDPEHAAVFEDALAGMDAGRTGGFGFVIGVNRTGQAEALERHGASVVVDDLADLLGERA